MGGILALKCSETIHPDVIVLVNSALPKDVGPPHSEKSYPDIIRWANGPLQETLDAMPDSDQPTIRWAHPKWRDESGAALRSIRAGIEVMKPNVPVLVVIGEKDTDILPSSSQALAEWCSADTMRFASTSHVGPLMGRRATEIAEAVRRWIDARK